MAAVIDRRATMFAGVAVAMLVIGTAWWRWRFLTVYVEPYGFDGYYYAIQLRELLAGRGLYYPAQPLVFWLLAPFADVLGPIQGVKLGAAIGTALATIPAYLIARRITDSRAAGVLAATIVAVSPQSVYLAGEFVKQGIGVTLALSFFAAFLAGAHVVATLFLVACFFAHKTAFGIAALFAIPPLLVRDRRARIAAVVIGAVAAIVAIRYRHLFADFFTTTIDDRAGFYPFYRMESFLALLCAFALIRRRNVLLAGPMLFALIAGNPWLRVADPSAPLTARLALTGFVALAILLPALVRNAKIAIPLAIALILFTPRLSPDQMKLPPSDYVAAFRALAPQVPRDIVILTPNHRIAFMATWFLDVEAREKPRLHDTRPVWRLMTNEDLQIDGVRRLRLFEASLPPHVVPPIHPTPTNRYLLSFMPDATWRRFVATHPPNSGKVSRSTHAVSHDPAQHRRRAGER